MILRLGVRITLPLPIEFPANFNALDFDPEDIEGAFGPNDGSSSENEHEDHAAAREHYMDVGYACTPLITTPRTKINEG